MNVIVQLLRAMATGSIYKEAKHDLILLAAAAKIEALADSVVEMEAYNDVPGAQDDPVWQGIRARGAEALSR